LQNGGSEANAHTHTRTQQQIARYLQFIVFENVISKDILYAAGKSSLLSAIHQGLFKPFKLKFLLNNIEIALSREKVLSICGLEGDGVNLRNHRMFFVCV